MIIGHGASKYSYCWAFKMVIYGETHYKGKIKAIKHSIASLSLEESLEMKMIFCSKRIYWNILTIFLIDR